MGHVYILSNKAMPGLLKIGFTDRTPQQRAQDLYTTGTPAPFVVEFSVELSGDAYKIEQHIHRRLDGFRFDSQREFFRMELPDAVQHVAAFIIEEKHPVVTLHGNHLNPFNKKHELAQDWQTIINAAQANKYRAKEAMRIADLKRKYNVWRMENSRITTDDIFMSFMITLFSTIGWISGFGAAHLAEKLRIIPPHNSTINHGLEIMIIAVGFFSIIPVVLYFYVRDKRKSNWGAVAPEEFKDVAE